MQITPFIYYIGILADNLNTEKSYDQLPNFTAADILRLTEIGRNQYIRLVSNHGLTYLTLYFSRENFDIEP